MGSDFDNEESGVPSIKRYWAVLYVFKFYNSNDIFFSCTVTVCPSGSSSCDIVSIHYTQPGNWYILFTNQTILCKISLIFIKLQRLLRMINILYLRNKETQQTLQVIINIQYDASF